MRLIRIWEFLRCHERVFQIAAIIAKLKLNVFPNAGSHYIQEK